MDHDEKTRREGFDDAPVGAPRSSARVTAPAGTTSARPAGEPAHLALDTLSPARTVGGHTVRLKGGEPEAPPAAPVDPVPASRTVGGTVRLEPVPLAPADVAEPPPASSGSAAFSPLAITVGVVSLAIGSILTITLDRRFRSTPTASAAPVPTGAVAERAPSTRPAPSTPPHADVTPTSTATTRAVVPSLPHPFADPPSREPPPDPGPPPPKPQSGGRHPANPPPKPKTQPFSPND